MGNERNEGEGNRTAARAYNEDQQKFVKSGKVKPAAEDAKRAVDGEEGRKLREAEEKGRARIKEEDPEIRRDPKKPAR